MEDSLNEDNVNMDLDNMSVEEEQEKNNKESADQEEVEQDDPLQEIVNPLKLDQFRKYLSNFTKTFSGMTFAYTTFNCSEKEIDEIEEEIGNFIHLRDVNISKNKIQKIMGFNNMTNLFRFDARENEIRDINIFSDPKKLKFLQLLYLSSNKIKTLPALYTDNLVELHLDNNLVKNASGFSIGLKNVKLINMSNNKLKDCIGFSNCPELCTLRLNDNEIQSFKGMENLPKLVYLDLSNNKFEYFANVPNLNDLKKINVSGNLISDIKEFGKLRFPNISDISNSNNPAIDEAGGSTKLEMLIIFEGFDLKIVNEEEVLSEEIGEAMDKKEERIRIFEEERILKEKEEAERLEQERIEKEAKEEEERLERLRIEEEEKLKKEEEEFEKQRLEKEKMEEENNEMEENNKEEDENAEEVDDKEQ
mmetsp:Transcript_33609/g.34901  ORF Transcript_33609/g.34901 Transcript_33609/m.34901 type:complete len:420 (-) Transcript_33609:14-1273(-)